jgi:hypothetical protein
MGVLVLYIQELGGRLASCVHGLYEYFAFSGIAALNIALRAVPFRCLYRR